jgi:transmembrane sensor
MLNVNKMNKMNTYSEEYIIRFLNGKLNAEEARDLDNWINSSPENAGTFESIRKIWLGTAACISENRFDEAKAWEKISGRINTTISGRKAAQALQRSVSFRKVLQIAAVAILLVSLGAAGSWFLISTGKTPVTDTYCEIVAPQGSKSQITLPDGSKAWINAGSKLSYRGDFNVSQRVVTLEGEGYFSVQSNKVKPFIVQTPYLKVKAYGTVFNVKAYPDEKTVETTLVEGIVEIEAGEKSADGSYKYTLKPKQNIIYHIDSGEAEQKDESVPEKEAKAPPKAETPDKEVLVISNIKPELYTSWKDENWVIEGMPLGNLSVMLGRRYNSRIDIEDEALRQYKFSGTIQNETLEQVLVILSLTTPLEYSIGKGNVSWKINRNLEKNYSRILKR